MCRNDAAVESAVSSLKNEIYHRALTQRIAERTTAKDYIEARHSRRGGPMHNQSVRPRDKLRFYEEARHSPALKLNPQRN